jgi:hypothetical protein
LAWARSARIYQKNNLKAKRAGGMAQAAQHLLSKHKFLDLIPVLKEKQTNKEKTKQKR